MKRFVRDNSLSLFFLALFLLALVGQSIAGYNVYNQEQLEHDGQTISYLRFWVSSDFGANVLENWQSEWLQFWLFALATVWFFQKGSNESKTLENLGLETDDLSPPARVGGVEARRRPARGNGQLGLGLRPGWPHVRSSAARRSFARFAGVRSKPGWSVERQRPSAS